MTDSKANFSAAEREILTPEAVQFRRETIQWARHWFTNPIYQFLYKESGTGVGHVMHEFVLMHVYQVLQPPELAPEPTEEVPEPVAPAYHLNDARVRTLLLDNRRNPLQFRVEHSNGTWGALVLNPGQHKSEDTLGRRFYAVEESPEFPLPGGGWNAIPIQRYSDTMNDPNKVALPDLDQPLVEEVYIACGFT